MGTGNRHIVARHLLSGAILMALAVLTATLTATQALQADPRQSDRPLVNAASQNNTHQTRPGARLLPNPLGTAAPAIVLQDTPATPIEIIASQSSCWWEETGILAGDDRRSGMPKASRGGMPKPQAPGYGHGVRPRMLRSREGAA